MRGNLDRYNSLKPFILLYLLSILNSQIILKKTSPTAIPYQLAPDQ